MLVSSGHWGCPNGPRWKVQPPISPKEPKRGWTRAPTGQRAAITLQQATGIPNCNPHILRHFHSERFVRSCPKGSIRNR